MQTIMYVVSCMAPRTKTSSWFAKCCPAICHLNCHLNVHLQYNLGKGKTKHPLLPTPGHFQCPWTTLLHLMYPYRSVIHWLPIFARLRGATSFPGKIVYTRIAWEDIVAKKVAMWLTSIAYGKLEGWKNCSYKWHIVKGPMKQIFG